MLGQNARNAFRIGSSANAVVLCALGSMMKTERSQRRCSGSDVVEVPVGVARKHGNDILSFLRKLEKRTVCELELDSEAMDDDSRK